mmetsp:Transcript_20186/g.41913  ORF Transcript_20186/g.41913 Transcript_20186/m.41913 type:complete len:99 (-) Transcript_20186:674-970(-)
MCFSPGSLLAPVDDFANSPAELPYALQAPVKIFKDETTRMNTQKELFRMCPAMIRPRVPQRLFEKGLQVWERHPITTEPYSAMDRRVSCLGLDRFLDW